ncbi:Ima1 N-terminal domain-containing protein [Xylariomycetidae sp. FL0641]|nr:Ima1 N-terminal domain-containing protein [Xylariomycetidae sp. FL0641]
MGTLRPRGFMRCFYCGKKSNIRFDGQRSFDCLTCDATNWLDEDGEITDPPINVSMTERDRVQFAIPRSASVRSPSPPSQPVDDPVFCGTCLRNQHMLASSLAQFEWPDNPSSAEYAARERKYYNLRKDLESRYPQMCPECEPKVEQKIAEASYTAQTDHLRRMMDRTRSHRRDTKKKGVLDTVDTAGKWCWYLAFTLQAMWHALILSALLAEQLASVDSNAWMTAVLGRLHRIVLIGRATDIDRLMRWAVTLGMFSFPWNPRFKQTIRGFTAHILGFRKWYTYQLLLSFVRFVCLSIAQYSRSQGLPATTHLGAQIVLAILVPYVSK